MYDKRRYSAPKDEGSNYRKIHAMYCNDLSIEEIIRNMPHMPAYEVLDIIQTIYGKEAIRKDRERAARELKRELNKHRGSIEDFENISNDLIIDRYKLFSSKADAIKFYNSIEYADMYEYTNGSDTATEYQLALANWQGYIDEEYATMYPYMVTYVEIVKVE